MPWLDFSQRLRVVSLYLDRRLSETKDKYSILKKCVQMKALFVRLGLLDESFLVGQILDEYTTKLLEYETLNIRKLK